MKKFAFLTVLVFPALSLFAQNTINYDKILQGDLSDFAGYWVNGNNDRVYLRTDGHIYYPSIGFSKTGGVYTWFEGSPGHQEGFSIMLFPIGVGVEGINTDKTRVRIYGGHPSGPSDPREIYYKESKFPATHVTSDKLRLRTAQNLSATTIKILEKGVRVLVEKWGDEATIDGFSARWAYVYTIDGFHGWCYSGYLEELYGQSKPKVNKTTLVYRYEGGMGESSRIYDETCIKYRNDGWYDFEFTFYDYSDPSSREWHSKVITPLDKETPHVFPSYEVWTVHFEYENQTYVLILILGNQEGASTVLRRTPPEQIGPKNGTYTFYPRPVGKQGGAESGGWLAKVVVRDGKMDLHLVDSPTGRGTRGGLSFGPPDSLILQDLDDPSKFFTAIGVPRFDQAAGAHIVPFRNGNSTRFSYIETRPNPMWIIEEIILGEPDS